MNVIPFAFGDSLVRVVMRDNEPWFVLADVCRVLEHSNPSVAANRLDEDEKGVSIVYTPGGPQETLCQIEGSILKILKPVELTGLGMRLAREDRR